MVALVLVVDFNMAIRIVVYQLKQRVQQL